LLVVDFAAFSWSLGALRFSRRGEISTGFSSSEDTSTLSYSLIAD
jgi:hypothetical protein